MPAAPARRPAPRRPRGWTVVAALAVALVLALRHEGSPVRPGVKGPGALVVVPSGTGVSGVANLLGRRGLIRSTAYFEAYAAVSGEARRLEAGTYRLSAAMSTAAILRKLANGETATATITVVPGMTVREVAARVAAAGLVTSAAFMQYVQGASPPRGFTAAGAVRDPLEGYLYPDTYRIPLGSDAAQVAAPMLAAFERAFGPSARAAAAREGLTPAQAVTLASIVEREASSPRVRREVAGVFLNRLKDKMPLGSDATVYYAAFVPPGGTLTRADFSVGNPYNTYLYKGLPPGPIDNPSGGSLAAVLHPDHVPYLYFFAKPDGNYVFSRTYAEQLAAQAQAKAAG